MFSLLILETDLPEVVHVIPDGFHELATTRTWEYLGLSSANPKNLLNDTNMGDQVIIGVIDTGISIYISSHCRFYLCFYILVPQ